MIRIFQASLWLFEFGLFQQPVPAFVVAPVDFAIHQLGEAVFKGQFRGDGQGELFLEGPGHAVESKRFEMVEGLLVQHRVSPGLMVITGAADVIVVRADPVGL